MDTEKKDSRSSVEQCEDTESYTTISIDESDAQAEWDESFRQIQFIFSALVFPLLGKYIGRQTAIRCEIMIFSKLVLLVAKIILIYIWNSIH